jgi:transposase
MKTVARYFIGVDLHQKVLQFCVVDRQGKMVREKCVRIPCLPYGEQVFEEFARWRGSCRVAVEAVGMNRWFVNGLLARGYEVVVADPTKLNLKMLGKKTDKRDARELARRLWLGDIDRDAKTYYPTDQVYGDRKLERTRHDLVELRQSVGNQIRALLRAYNVAAPAVVLYSERGLKGLGKLTLVNDQLTLCLHQLTAVLAGVQAAIEALKEGIESRAEQEPVIRTMVEQLYGVGPMSALTIVSELGDVHRFRDADAVASYAGLVPRVYDSGGKEHHGRLTKRGNRELRFVLSQWAIRMIAKHPMAKAWAESRRKRKHINKVRMSLARKLLIGVWIMLKRGEVFDLQRCLAS